MPSRDSTEAGSVDVGGPDAGRGSASRRLDPDEDVSTAVVMTIGEVTDTDPTALSPPMSEVIDPGALDALFAPSRTPRTELQVEFELYGCRVAVDGDRRIEVHRVE